MEDDEIETRHDDEIVTLRGVSWRELEHRLAIKDDAPVPRIAYLDGVLELMSPSVDHERAKSNIGALVEFYALDANIEISSVGSWLLKNKRRRVGCEPDECYIIGPYGRRKRPHLAIEVIHTSGSINKLEVYERLDVPEVWFWKRGKIVVHVLRKGAWATARRSGFLPGLDLDLLCSCLDRPSTTAAIRAFRDALRTPHA
ncbi:MAG: hypothetical protein JWO36_5247 [Myxococcales bacterium]|nr:hypothetical protein [Myxococcales bacterium]